MNKAQMRGVQRLTAKVQLIEQVSVNGFSTIIGRIAEQRMAIMRHMDTNLVRPAGFQAACDQRGGIQPLDGGEMRHRVLAVAIVDHRHLLAIARRSTDIAGHRSILR